MFSFWFVYFYFFNLYFCFHFYFIYLFIYIYFYFCIFYFNIIISTILFYFYYWKNIYFICLCFSWSERSAYFYMKSNFFRLAYSYILKFISTKSKSLFIFHWNRFSLFFRVLSYDLDLLIRMIFYISSFSIFVWLSQKNMSQYDWELSSSVWKKIKKFIFRFLRRREFE